MKFFIPLGHRYGKDGPDLNSHVGSVYGPYENGRAVEEALMRLFPNNKTAQFLIFDGQIVKVKASPLEKPEHEKRSPGNMNNYVKGIDNYRCKDCQGIVIAGRVAHPIHFRGTNAGHGECQYETVPYCPNCDREPDFNGDPVYID